jgi:hypothetical protein
MDAELYDNLTPWYHLLDPVADHADDTTYLVDFAFLLRDGTELRSVHDRHLAGLFSRATWLALLADVGFKATSEKRPLEEGATDEILVCRRPGA